MTRGMLSYVPGFERFLTKLRGGGGTRSPRYCYSVWLRHLAMAREHGLSTAPATVAELGPGDSVGVGLAALLTGSERYWALDVLSYTNSERNLQIFDGLVDLLRNRASIPNGEEFTDVQPTLDSYAFPGDILTPQRLAAALSPERLERVHRAIVTLGAHSQPEHALLSYISSWDEAANIPQGSVDAIFSQAVLEHVDDLAATYKAMDNWLKPGGYMSHQIDFRSHNLTQAWNGHWALSDFQWNMMRGKRAYFLNRQPYSRHLHLLSELGFSSIVEHRIIDQTGIQREALAARFRHLSEQDLETSGLFVQAVKTRARR
jgi:SAM-dependent methyltransferase